MKKLIDGTEVLDRTFYYLLDWKDKNMEYVFKNYGTYELHALNKKEYKEFFEHATKQDLKNI